MNVRLIETTLGHLLGWVVIVHTHLTLATCLIAVVETWEPRRALTTVLPVGAAWLPPAADIDV